MSLTTGTEIKKPCQEIKKNLMYKLMNRINNVNNYAPLQSRFFAYLIDFFLSSIFVSILPMLITSIITQKKSFAVETFIQLTTGWQLFCCVIATLLGIYYFCLYPMNKDHLGQTIGKKIMKIKITNIEGKDLTYKNIFYRELLGSMMLEGETSFPAAYFRYFAYKLLPTHISSTIYVVSIILSVVSIIWAIFNQRHLMFHDYVGKTVLVKA